MSLVPVFSPTFAGWDLSEAYYDDVSFSIAAQVSNPTGVVVRPDGRRMFVLSPSAVYQYSMTRTWDVSTASYDSLTLDVSGQATAPSGLFFKDDGARLFIIDGSTDRVYQYSLSTAWELGTASYDGVSFSVGDQASDASDLQWREDGAMFFVVDNDTDRIHRYSASTPWDVATASYDGISFSVRDQTESPQGAFFHPDGSRMFIAGEQGDLLQYSIATAWDVSTASYDSVSFNMPESADRPHGLSFRPSGLALFAVSNNSGAVYQIMVG